jgi:hypothetical protein
LQRTWEKDNALANYGYWTDYNEGWYQKRLKQLQENENPQPLGEARWKDNLRGIVARAKPIRDANLKFVSEVARECLCSLKDDK